ncbi:MAG: DNA primase [Rhodoblastus sp.]
MTRRPRSPDSDRDFQAWIDRAKRMPIDDVLRRLGHLPLADDRGGPCPRPGCCDPRKSARQSDRFSINRRKGLFYCRASGAGGPNFELVRHVTDMRFVDAVEFVSGEKPPSFSREETEAERAERFARLEQAERDAQARRAEQERTSAVYREDERRRAFKIWRKGVEIAGTPVEAYLARRGLVAPAQARLRYLADEPYYIEGPDKEPVELFRGPCMAAAMLRHDAQRGGEIFACLHRTWIDLDDSKGKRRIVDPDSGELIGAKKMRGSKKGASILLARKPDADGAIVRWFLGEGIENALSVWRALFEACDVRLDGAEFRAAGDLGNMSGKAAARAPHPSETFVDRAGRKRRRTVPGPDPLAPDDDPVIFIPAGVRELFLIEDGSSEPFFTDCAIRRAAARFARENPELEIRRIKSAPGLDHNAMLMEGAA